MRVVSMDYQFRRDVIGIPEARFSMNYEAMAAWLMEEVGQNRQTLGILLTTIENLNNKSRWEYQQDGQQYHLLLTRETAEVRAALLDSEMHSEESESLDYYDSESSSHCGLDDFKTMLLSWQEFIQSS